MLNNAQDLNDLRVPTGNRLEALIYFSREFPLREKILDAVDQVILAQHLTMLEHARPWLFRTHLFAARQAAL